MKNKSIEKLRRAIEIAWSLESSSLWKPDNPALGQCGVTALVVNHILGGEILKTKYGEIWHFYNLIDGEIFDLTESQFEKEISYTNQSSNREEAFADTNLQQYNYLKSAVKYNLKR